LLITERPAARDGKPWAAALVALGGGRSQKPASAALGFVAMRASLQRRWHRGPRERKRRATALEQLIGRLTASSVTAVQDAGLIRLVVAPAAPM